MPKFYLTTPIYYVNARPHIGHAYTTIAADVIARRHRLLGDDTYFLTGTDEHGQKIERSAAAAGIPPQQFADQVSTSFSNLWQRMGITHDQFIRTTDAAHKRGVQKLFTTLQSLDKIYLSSYTGQYSIGEEMFVDGPPGTIGPDGKPTETVTEENYFFRLSEYQLPLINLIESGELAIQPEVRKNEVLSFLRGNITEGDTTELSAAGTPYLPGALKDLSISRSSFQWGVPVPNDPKHVIYVWLDALANYMTALGYGSEDPADIAKFEKYWPADLHLVGKEIIRFHCVYWPAFLLAANLPLPKAITAHGWLLFEDSKMSKSRGNIVRTETILEAFGTLCPPPPTNAVIDPATKTVILSEASQPHREAQTKDPEEVHAPTTDENIQTNSPAPPTLTKHHQDLFAADVLRYFLLREIPFGQDGSFSFDALVQRYNSDLANGYGNLVSRTLAMIEKNFEGVLPANASEPFAESESLQTQAQTIIAATHEDYSNCQLTRAATSIASLVGISDVFFSGLTPWKLAKSEAPADRHRLAQTLYTAAESIRIITALLYPILPYATAEVWAQLGLDPTELTTHNSQLTTLAWGGLKPGTKLGPLSPIFPRAPKELTQIMTDMESPNTPTPSKLVDETTAHTAPVPVASTDPAAPPRTSALTESNPGAQVAGSATLTTERPETPSHTEAPASGAFATAALASTLPDTPQIAIDDFVKIDLRVARIIVAERIPKADKLLRLEVDLGYETRQILSGIAQWYTPEELIGRRIVIIANLAPRKMRGLESHGMLLAASAGEDGKPVLATFNEDIALGSRLK